MKITKEYVFVDEGEQVEPATSPAQVKIQETVSDAFGLFVWPSALTLSHYVWDHREELRGKAVMELGAGVGLPGLLAAHPLVGARRVLLTDRKEGLQVLANARETVALNGYQEAICRVRGLSWGFPEEWWAEEEVEVILGSDCFYHEGDYQDLLFTLTYFIGRQPQGRCRCLMAYHDRGSETLYYSLERWGLQGVDHGLPPRLADDEAYASITILEITKAPPPTE